MRAFIFLALACSVLSLSACSWFHRKPPAPPDPPELIVTGAPAGSIVFIDDVQKGQLAELNDQPQVLDTTEGAHKIEVRIDDKVVYREDTYVSNGDKRVITVLSGSNRE